MSPQEIIDTQYERAYQAIWAKVDPKDPKQVEEALDRTQKAWDKVAQRIYRETGYIV